MQGTRAYELRSQPLQNLSQRAMAELFAVVRSEIELGRLELDEKARAGANAGRSFGLATLFLLLAAASLSAAILAGLTTFAPFWVAALILGLAYAIVAIVFANRGRFTLVQAGGLFPERTLDRVLGMPAVTSEDAYSRSETAHRDLDRAVAAIGQRGAGQSPVRDAVLSGIAVTLAAVLQARNGQR
jgi:hypothetical protein